MQQLPCLLARVAPHQTAEESVVPCAPGGLDIADPGCCIMQHQSRATLEQQEFILLQAQLSSGFRRTLEGVRGKLSPSGPRAKSEQL